MKTISFELECQIDDWKNLSYYGLNRSIGFTEKEIIENDFIKTVLCLYYNDRNGLNSDDISEMIISTVSHKFGLKFHSKQSLPMAGSIRRELYFTV